MKLEQWKKTPGHLLRRAQQASTAIFTEELQQYELTSVQFLALVAIIEHGALDATRMAELIYFDRATIGGVIERLERKGLVERTASLVDRRVKVVKITERGRALVHACTARVEHVQHRLLDPLTSTERTQFLELLQKVARENK